MSHIDGYDLTVTHVEAARRKICGTTGTGGGDCFALVDGGEPDTFFGGVTPLDGGAVVQ